MKRRIFKCGVILSVLSMALFLSNMITYASVIEDNTEKFVKQNEEIGAFSEATLNQGAETLEITDESLKQQVSNNESICIQGLEGMSIRDIQDISLSKTRSSCGINHIWKAISTIQESSCEKEGIHTVKCAICEATGMVYTDALEHKYVNGICTVCEEFEAVEVEKWEYELNEANKTITLKRYISNVPEVIIYGEYNVNGKLYSTVINGGGKFYDKREIITSVVINKGVSCLNLYGFFYNCTKLTSVDISDFDTSKVTNMAEMFYGCYSLVNLDAININTSNVTDMHGMFYNCSQLKELDVSHFDTSKVYNMNFMFSGCGSLTNLDVSKFDTSKVTSMYEMFVNCNSLTNLDVSKFDTSKVKMMYSLFTGCSSLTKLDLSNFDTSNSDCLKQMFSYCRNLISVDISNFDTSNVGNMENMFYECQNLKSVNLKNINTSNVYNMRYMFYNCKNLTSLDLSGFNTLKAEDMCNMFRGASNLTKIYVDKNKWNTSNAINMGMFAECGTQNVTYK